jgi:cell division protein FtsI/penicillin-binding protein 2
MAKTTNERLVAVCAGCLVGLGVLWVRCVWLQVIEGPALARYARTQYRISQPLVAPRGTIRDREGRVLAMSVRAPSVC